MASHTHEDCIKSLKEATEELGRPPSASEYQNLGRTPSVSYLSGEFGSWNAAKEAAGLELNEISRRDCIKALQEVAEQLDHSPTTREYRDLPISPSAEAIKNRFGSWNDAKKAAGLDVWGELTEEDCIRGLQEAADRLGHSPSYAEYRELDQSPSHHSIEQVFGSWNAAKEAADLETEERKIGTPIQEDYFDPLDSAETAYWLGFLFGDGSIYKGKNRYTLKLELQRRDGHHVRAFSHAIGSGYKISERDRHVPTTVMHITNQAFVQGVLDTGFRPSKEFIPDIPEEHRLAFIRGLFDADGYVGRSGSVFQWTITSIQEPILRAVQKWLSDCGISATIYSRTPQEETYSRAYNLCIQNRPGGRGVYNTLWPDGLETTPCLQRKAEAFETALAE